MTAPITRFLAAFILLAGLLLRPAPASADANDIVLETGASTILNTPGLTRVATGDASVAGVAPIGTSQVLINGKSPGRATVYVWTDYGGVDRYEVYVSGQMLNDMVPMLKAALDLPDVQVVPFHNAIVIKGTVKDLGEDERIHKVIDQFKGLGQPIIDAVNVPHPLGTLDQELARLPGAEDIHLDYDPKGTGDIIVSGRVHDRQEAEVVLAHANGLAGRYLNSDAKVIDRLAVDLTSQIDIKVYVLEVDKQALSQLGVNLQAAIPVPGSAGEFTFNPNGPSFPIVEEPNASAAGKAFNIGPFFRSAFLAPTLEAVLQSGHARELSAPDLVTRPGDEAKFLVGGSIPYVYETGLNAVSIQFQQYGVQLDVTPTILGNGKIECKIAPTISDLDYANAVEVEGFLLPALKTSQLSTDVVTSEGQGIVMGGMLRHLEQKTIYKIPLLSQIPILGKLFQSVHYLDDQTDVVFVLLPTIINQ